MTRSPEQALWQEVLFRQIDDALNGPSGISGADARNRTILEARQYLTQLSADLIFVCNGAEIDTIALIERMRVKIADAPTPEQIVSEQKTLRTALSKQAKNPKTTIIKCIDRVLTHDGRTMTMAQWADHTGLTVKTIAARLRLDWTLERALTQPISRRNLGWGVAGVVSDFGASQGTGGGRSAQDTPEIGFSDRKGVSQ
jgi:hypothetical protein